jgi:Fatty acid hydroxylase superfamily
MFSTWQGKATYLAFGILALLLTSHLTRPGFEKSLTRPVTRGFGPPCTLWQAWRLFCSFFWEQMLLAGVVVSCAIRLALGHWRLVDGAIAIGIAAVFPFIEYLSHRHLLHGPAKSADGPRRESLAALVHRVHHRDPWHMERAINPQLSVVLYAVGLPVVFFPFFSPPQAMTGVAASWIVLFWYEWIHLLIHTSYVPRNALYNRIWRNHRLHHFKNEHFWYNVSTYGVDSLLGTKPHPTSVPTSPTCLTLDETEAILSGSADSIGQGKSR